MVAPRPAGGSQRPRTVDPTVQKDAIDALTAVSDTTQRTGRPGARVIPDITIVAGTPTVVDHGCGSDRIQWVVCDVRSAAGAMIWRTDVDASSLTLQASANCTIAIEVWST